MTVLSTRTRRLWNNVIYNWKLQGSIVVIAVWRLSLLFDAYYCFLLPTCCLLLACCCPLIATACPCLLPAFVAAMSLCCRPLVSAGTSDSFRTLYTVDRIPDFLEYLHLGERPLSLIWAWTLLKKWDMNSRYRAIQEPVSLNSSLDPAGPISLILGVA